MLITLRCREGITSCGIYLRAAFIIMIVAYTVATNRGWLLLKVQHLTNMVIIHTHIHTYACTYIHTRGETIWIITILHIAF